MGAVAFTASAFPGVAIVKGKVDHALRVGAILPQHRLEHPISTRPKVQPPASPDPRGVVDSQHFQSSVLTQGAGSIPQLLAMLHKHAAPTWERIQGVPYCVPHTCGSMCKGDVLVLTSQSPGFECPPSYEP